MFNAVQNKNNKLLIACVNIVLVLFVLFLNSFNKLSTYSCWTKRQKSGGVGIKCTLGSGERYISSFR